MRLLAVLILLVSCAKTPNPLKLEETPPLFEETAQVTSFRNAPPPKPNRRSGEDAWARGDNLVLGFLGESPAGKMVRYLRLEVLTGDLLHHGDPKRHPSMRDMRVRNDEGEEESLTSATLEVGLTVHDSLGKDLVRQDFQIHERFYRQGLLAAAMQAAGSPRTETRMSSEGSLAMVSFISMLRQIGPLRPMLELVFDRPSALAYLFNAGSGPEFHYDFTSVRRNPVSGFLEVAGKVILYGHDLVFFRMGLTEPRYPFLLMAGIAQLELVHPRNPGQKLLIKVLAPRGK